MKHLFNFLIAATFIIPYNAVNAQSVNINGPAGSQNFGYVYILPNGNFVVSDPYYDDGAIVDVGAAYLYNGSTRLLISMLKGSATNDRIGINGITVLPNG